MPTPKEIDALAGEQQKPSEPSAPAQETVSLEDYQKIAGNYENMRSEYNRRDKEIAALREENERLKSKKVDDSEDPEEDDSLKEKIRSWGFVSEQEAEKRVEERIRLESRTKELQAEMREATTKMPFVKEADVLEFLKKKGGNLTITEAVQLMYPNELAKFQTTGSDELPETDSGGRTIATTPLKDDNGIPMKRGYGKNTDFLSTMSRRLDEAINKR